PDGSPVTVIDAGAVSETLATPFTRSHDGEAAAVKPRVPGPPVFFTWRVAVCVTAPIAGTVQLIGDGRAERRGPSGATRSPTVIATLATPVRPAAFVTRSVTSYEPTSRSVTDTLRSVPSVRYGLDHTNPVSGMGCACGSCALPTKFTSCPHCTCVSPVGSAMW